MPATPIREPEAEAVQFSQEQPKAEGVHSGQQVRLRDALAMPGGEDIEFEPPKLGIGIRPADF